MNKILFVVKFFKNLSEGKNVEQKGVPCLKKHIPNVNYSNCFLFPEGVNLAKNIIPL